MEETGYRTYPNRMRASMSPTQASSSPYDPHILAAELGKLFDLPLTANMISLDGVHFRTWSGGDTGVLRVELVKSVSTSQARQIFKAARIPSEEEVRRDALEAELWAARQELAELKGKK